jgi:4-amino-4-deoxy-L-arabinose transferase-like glycosyltransferase
VFDIQQANMPATINMLYTLGMAFGSDELPSVLHLVLSAITTLAVFAFGRQFFSARVGWMAAMISVSTLLMVVFGAVPNVEWGLALFDFLGVYAFLQWHRSGRRNWLLLSGTLMGLSLGSKYLGGITGLALGLTLVVLAFKQRSTIGWSGILTLLLTFGVPAALIASPWYLKNWVWLGNPLWPLLGYDPNDYNQYISPIVQYPGGLLGRALSPFHLYVRGSVEYSGVRPPLALLAVPFYVLLPRHRVVTGLLALALFHFVIWAQGCHVLRYIA